MTISEPTALSDLLSTIRFVLVNTTLPANIGSAARAMHTMGLSNLVVVAPKHPIDATSYSHAKGGVPLLDNACLVDTIEDAVADCHLVFAASSRSRTVPRPVVTPSEAAHVMMDLYQKLTSAQTAKRPMQIVEQRQTALPNPSDVPQHKRSLPKFAVLFGREDRGLTNEELALADYHIQIDANPSYPVLNVAAAVQVIASFLYAHFLAQTQKSQGQRSGNVADNESGQDEQHHRTDHNTVNQVELTLRQNWDEPPATFEQTQKLQTQLIGLMHTLDLTNSDDPAKLRELPSRLSRLESRLQLDQKECEILTAIVAKLCRRLNV